MGSERCIRDSFMATTPDPSGPGDGGVVPACGAMAAFIEKASGVAPYFVGKPNPLMMRTCLLYTSDAADERSSVDLGGRRIIKKKKKDKQSMTHSVHKRQQK